MLKCFQMKRFLPYITFSSGSSYSKLITLEVYLIDCLHFCNGQLIVFERHVFII